MKKNSLTTCLFLLWWLCLCHPGFTQYDYEPSDKFPYGKLNPAAPPQTADYEALIGKSHCKSVARKPDGTWSADTVDMIWKFRYHMNGMAVLDETLKADQSHSSSIRQFHTDSARWYVTYFSTAVSPAPGVWSGGKEGNEIHLYRPQKAPNGMDGFYKLSFTDITDEGFNWKGQWVDPSEQMKYPTWVIFCRKEL
ncbi:MAG: hypothetical protein AAF693_21855 [Bacteroidota bacterium]